MFNVRNELAEKTHYIAQKGDTQSHSTAIGVALAFYDRGRLYRAYCSTRRSVDIPAANRNAS